MTKFPLSVTTGPALALAILSLAFGDPNLFLSDKSAVEYAKGATSIGTPWVHYKTMMITDCNQDAKTSKHTVLPRISDFLR